MIHLLPFFNRKNQQDKIDSSDKIEQISQVFKKLYTLQRNFCCVFCGHVEYCTFIIQLEMSKGYFCT